jgi:tRNA pseudouridine38-40 synthase
MPTYKLTLAYDGTAYAGWQQQLKVPSVFGTLERTFRRAFAFDVHLLGASRTDAGVHALGQVVRCVMPLEIEPARLARILNNSLPVDIQVRRVERVADTFHPHYNVARKTYYYHIFVQRPLPFVARYGWHYEQPLDPVKLEAVLLQCVGTHDFRSFCCAQEKRTDTIRTIDTISLRYLRRFKAYRIVVTGEKFLHHMIRRIVGASVQIASNPTIPLCSIQEVLEARDPRQTLHNAPAQGLLLYSILYNKDKADS